MLPPPAVANAVRSNQRPSRRGPAVNVAQLSIESRRVLEDLVDAFLLLGAFVKASFVRSSWVGVSRARSRRARWCARIYAVFMRGGVRVDACVRACIRVSFRATTTTTTLP
jgi:hypothetical protein